MARSILLDLSDTQLDEGAQSLYEAGYGALRSGNHRMAMILLTLADAAWNEIGERQKASMAREWLSTIEQKEVAS